jgi:hypothetical protein
MFNMFLFINIDGDQNIGEIRTIIKTRSFLFWVVHLKGFPLMVGIKRETLKQYKETTLLCEENISKP